MGLDEDLDRIAAAATAWAAPGEQVAAVIPTEPAPGRRVYLVAFAGAQGGVAAGAEEGATAPGSSSWLALDDAGAAVEHWPAIREAVSIAALCELAEEMAGGGDLDDLRSKLVGLRVVESPPGIDEAIAAVDALEKALGRPPRLASPGYLDAVGGAVRGLERALGETGASPFAEAMKQAPGAIDALTLDVQAGLKTRRP